MSVNSHALELSAGNNFSVLYVIDSRVNGQPVALADFTAITFRAVSQQGNTTITKSLSNGITKIPADQVPIMYPQQFKEPRDGVIRIDLSRTDTATAGVYNFQIDVENTSSFLTTLETSTLNIMAKV